MSFSFWDKETNSELIMRISRGRSDEDARHRARSSEITQDWTSRGFSASSGLFMGLWEEALNHQKQLARISTEQLLTMLRAKQTKLSDSDVNEIEKSAIDSFNFGVGSRRTDLAADVTARGLPSHILNFDSMKGPVLQDVLHDLRIRIAEYRREQETAKKTWWSERIEKVIWAGGGSAATLLVQWLENFF